MMNGKNNRKAILCAAAALLAAALCSCAAYAPTDTRPAAYPSLREALTNEDEIITSIRSGLRAYSSRITVSFTYGSDILNELSALTGEWVEAALQETEDPCEGDYIRYQYGGYESTCSYAFEDGVYLYTVEIVPDYYIYYVQEQEMSALLEEAYRELALDGNATDYEKIHAIYDYVCSHVKYDKIHQKSGYYHAKSTAYAALSRHTATCQGYSVLLYRMLRENGIDCRVVTGLGMEEAGERLHAWNIAAVDGKYYNLDATWDAGAEEYRYFLRGSGDYENHTAGEAFQTEAFLNRYPMAAEAYRPVG